MFGALADHVRCIKNHAVCSAQGRFSPVTPPGADPSIRPGTPDQCRHPAPERLGRPRKHAPRQSALHRRAASPIRRKPGIYAGADVCQTCGFVLGSPRPRSPSFHFPLARRKSIRSKRFITLRLAVILLADFKLACCVIIPSPQYRIRCNVCRFIAVGASKVNDIAK